jgi:hypothetical protein
MPSTDGKLELKAKDIDGSDRLTPDCVLTELASPAVSRTAVYANGSMGARGGTVVEAPRYKPEGRGIDSRWCHSNFSLT